MKFLVQRVTYARVSVEGEVIGEIGQGLLVFFGAGAGDTEELARRYAEKITKLRIFQDEDGKTNLALADVGGELMVISQFTLYADCKKGNRPNFLSAAPPAMANALYKFFVACCRESIGKVETGSFGAEMQVELTNDGPFTLFLDSAENS